MGSYINKPLKFIFMKHTLRVTALVLAVFFFTQILGLVIVNNYIDKQELTKGNVVFKALPLDVERPEVDAKTSFVYIVVAILIGTALALLLIKFRFLSLWKIWFLIAVFITLTVAFKTFVPELIALVMALVLAIWKIYKPNFYVHNFTEMFIYGGLAAIFVPILNLFSVVMLLVFISAYDAYAVWKSKHMIRLAKFQTKSRMFAGVVIPYSIPKVAKGAAVKHVKIKTAILGGGDIGFPLLFAGVLFKDLILKNSILISFSEVLIVPVCATIALGWLLYKADKDKFYPAMPFISVGCFVALGLMYLIGFV